MEPACVSSCPSVALFAGEEKDVVSEAKRRAEEYAKTYEQDFIAYGTDSVSRDVGYTGWVTVAPKADAEAYGLKENPKSLTLKVRDATATFAGIGTLGVAGAVGVHFLHWLGRRKKTLSEDSKRPSVQSSSEDS